MPRKYPSKRSDKPAVVVVGIKSYKLHQTPDHVTMWFVKELRDNGIRVRSYDFDCYKQRNIFIVPIQYKKTTGTIRRLSLLLPSSVFILYGTKAHEYTALITEGNPVVHTVYHNCIPTEDYDWSN